MGVLIKIGLFIFFTIMNKGVGIWLLIMIIPFLIGMFIHFILPLQFILNGHQRVEQSYNFYKSSIEQNTVRATSYLNSKTVTNKLQLYANIRSSLARLFDFGISYLTIQTDQIPLNSAFQLANSSPQQLEQMQMNCSMWYAPNTFQLSQLSSTQTEIFTKYSEIQPFVNSYLSVSQIPEGIISIETYINFDLNSMYFRFPSAVIPQFSELNSKLLEKEYNQTVLNYQHGHFETNFNNKKILKTCTPFFGQTIDILGIVCFQISTQILLKDITRSISSPKLKQIESQYFLLLPIYPSSPNQASPSIIANFSVKDLSEIDFYFQQQHFFPMQTAPTLTPSLFLGLQNYILNVNSYSQTIYQENKHTTFYITPIATDFTFFRNQSIELYLLIMNSEVNLDIVSSEYFKDIKIALITPTILITFISMILTTVILKNNLDRLDKALTNLNQYSMLILKGDLGLQIPAYSGTEDLSQLFQKFQILNLLSKYSEPLYFQVPKPERIIKYLKCAQLFDQLGYSKVNLYQNIADCYFGLGDNQKAIKNIQKSILQSEKVLFENGQTIDDVYGRKVQQLANGNIRYVQKRSRQRRMKEKNMRRRLLKYAKYLYQAFQPGTPSESERLGNIVLKLKKLTFPRVLNNEYLASNIIDLRYKFRDRNFGGMEEKLNQLDQIIVGYESLHSQGNQDCKTPPDIMRSYFRFMKACWFNINKKPLEAFNEFVGAMKGNYFHPLLHKLAMEELKKICLAYQVNPNCLNQFYFLQQYRPRGKREYIFLIDTSNPKMSYMQVKKWKSRCRKFANYIFQELIYPDDRLAIYGFNLDLQICLNLTKKQHQLTIMKKEISRSFKCKEQYGYSNILLNLNNAIERVRNLKQQKVFIVILKNGHHIDGREITKMIKNFDMRAKFIFLTDFPQNIIGGGGQDFYIIDLDAFIDLERVLNEKKHSPDDTQIYIF